MPSNNRIIYATQAASISPMGTPAASVVATHIVNGLQSAATTTNFNLEQVFELGQLDIYENIEGLPEIEITLEKALDGYPLMYLLATTGVQGQASGILNRSKQQCDVRLYVFDETRTNAYEAIGAAGEGRNTLYSSGMYISNVSYTLPADGNSTESITFVGNNKQWLVGVAAPQAAFVAFSGGLDEPKALCSSGGIQRREDFIHSRSILPQAIEGVRGTGFGNGSGAHIQNITISTDFSREDIFELGRKSPYYRPAAFPIEVTCEIEAIAMSGDFVQALETGDPNLFSDCKSSGNNLRDEQIYIATRGGYHWNLGTRNKLSSVSYGGGDAGGGNVSSTYSFTNFNVLGVLQQGITGTGTAFFG